MVKIDIGGLDWFVVHLDRRGTGGATYRLRYPQIDFLFPVEPSPKAGLHQFGRDYYAAHPEVRAVAKRHATRTHSGYWWESGDALGRYEGTLFVRPEDLWTVIPELVTRVARDLLVLDGERSPDERLARLRGLINADCSGKRLRWVRMMEQVFGDLPTALERLASWVQDLPSADPCPTTGRQQVDESETGTRWNYNVAPYRLTEDEQAHLGALLAHQWKDAPSAPASEPMIGEQQGSFWLPCDTPKNELYLIRLVLCGDPQFWDEILQHETGSYNLTQPAKYTFTIDGLRTEANAQQASSGVHVQSGQPIIDDRGSGRPLIQTNGEMGL